MTPRLIAHSLIALALVAGASFACATPEEDCVARIHSWAEQQLEACESDDCDTTPPGLEALCPELAARLAGHPLAPALARPPGQRAPADAAQIDDVLVYYESVEPARRPDLDALPGVLERMREPAPRRLSLREQFWRWLTHKLGLDEFEMPEWTEDISIPPLVVDTVFYGSIALLLILAVAVVVNELRQRRGGGGRPVTARWSLEAGPAPSPPTLAELEAAPLSEQPRLLLALAIHTLASKGVIDYRGSMTHRQLAAAGERLPDGRGLVELSTAAERCAYGGWEPSAGDIDNLRRAGQGLLGGGRV